MDRDQFSSDMALCPLSLVPPHGIFDLWEVQIPIVHVVEPNATFDLLVRFTQGIFGNDPSHH